MGLRNLEFAGLGFEDLAVKGFRIHVVQRTPERLWLDCTQRLQNPLTKEWTLKYSTIPNMI